MYMEVIAAKLLQFMEALPRKAPQNWLSDFNKGELFLLNYLHTNEDTACPTDMSEAMQTSTARIAAALNNLERKGFITRESATDGDLRRKLVHLTPEGNEYVKEYRSKALRNITKLLTELGEQDATEYLRITQRIEVISRELNFDL